jgi:hypothetical protein
VTGDDVNNNNNNNNKSNENSGTKNEGIQHIKANLGKFLKKKWGSRVMFGQYMQSMDRQVIGGEGRFLWLSWGDLKVK